METAIMERHQLVGRFNSPVEFALGKNCVRVVILDANWVVSERDG
jgi:hypothetical protein